MENLIIAATDETPAIELNANGVLSLQGISMPEDPSAFYQPVLAWMRQYVASPVRKIQLEIGFTYFNSTSAKRIFQLIQYLEQAAEKGSDVKVIWKHESDDDLIRDKGLEIQQLTRLPFEIVSVD
jgi:hypothetical protein